MAKYKNYKNSYTKNNIIHSLDNVMIMPFKEVASRRKELSSQYKQIGFPSNQELSNSSNVVYVEAYTKDDGTSVRAHWRSKPGAGGIYPEQNGGVIVENPSSDGVYTNLEPVWKKLPNGKEGIEVPTEDYRKYFPKTEPAESEPQAEPETTPEDVEINPEDLEDWDPSKPLPGVVFRIPSAEPDEEGSSEESNPIGTICKVILEVLQVALEAAQVWADMQSGKQINITTTTQQIVSKNLPIAFKQVGLLNNNQTSTNENEIVLKTSVDKLTNDLMNEFEKKGVFNNPKKGVRISNEDMIDIQNTVSRNLDNVSLQKSLQGGVRTDVQKEDGLNFADRKLTNPQSLRLPSGEYSESDLDRYRDSLLKPIQEQNQNKLVSFVKDLGKGAIQGISSIGTGLGKRYSNTIRELMGKEPLSQEEIDNIYGKVVGNKSEDKAYKTGELIGEIVPFLIMPEVRVASFPLIANLLLTNMYQSVIDGGTQSIINHGVSKRLVSDVIHSVAINLLNLLAMYGLFRGVDKTAILKKFEQRLKTLTDELAKMTSKPIVQSDGTIVMNKVGGHDVRSIKDDINKYIEKAKREPAINIKLPNEDKGTIYHNIETYGFTEKEINDGYAARFSANYGVIIRIYDGSIGHLLYTIIGKWRLK